MANKTFDFNKRKKGFLTVTLPDNKKTVLLVGNPTKKITSELMSLYDSIDSENENVIDDLYDICAKIMSRNKGGIEITKEYIEEILDIEDVTLFISSYSDFISSIYNEKN